MKKHKAIAIFSGGLDSILSVKWMQRLGYLVQPVFFAAPYFPAEKAQFSASQNGFDLLIRDISPEHLQMLLNPKYGYGKHFNPCIDCHALMFNTAGKMLEELDADFIISGEVLGQRPMSQRKDAINAVAKHSGVKDLIIRPLSQKLLASTKPIREGWVNINDLWDIQGRGRHRQIALAAELEIPYYPTPGGGCLLTDAGYSKRLRELLDHGLPDRYDLELLRFGRHFRLSPKVKFILGRDEHENEALLSHYQGSLLFDIPDQPCPIGILTGSPIDRELISLAASLLMYYNKKATDDQPVLYGENILDHSVQAGRTDPQTITRLRIG